MNAIHLRTEYLDAPLGIDITEPRFYWHCEGGLRQSAYIIIAKRNDEIIWNSGKVESSAMTHIHYEGKPLQSRDRVEWSVKLWDERDEDGDWAESFFEMGLLQASDWSAKWISGSEKPKKHKRLPVDCFLKEFSCSKEIQKARLYITACGIYEAELNSVRVGDCFFTPGSTDYRKRVQYQTYDVTKLLQTENQLKIQLADGWYRGSLGTFAPTNVFGRVTKLLCQLELTFTDDTVQVIISGEDFRWSNDGPIRFADLKDGEIIDASCVPGYSGKARAVKETVVPTASNNVMVKEQESFTATVITSPSGKKILDFGQNIAGYIAFSALGTKGQKINLRFGETLDKDGEFTQKNFQVEKPVKEYTHLTKLLVATGNGSKIRGEMQLTPKQELSFSCSGKQDFYKTKFAFFGFRYVLVETDSGVDISNITAIAVYSDVEKTANFSCSNPKMNRLYENIVWSMKGNILDLPTDCPTRERLAWTGDAQVFFNTAVYLTNIAPLYRKFLADMRDNQFKNGKISAVVPYNGINIYDFTGESVGWSDASVLIPYRFWKAYGDTAILEENYEMMRAYAMFMIKNTGHRNRRAAKENPFNQYVYEKGHQLGEWLEPELYKDNIKAGKLALQTEVATAYLHYTMTLISQIAHELGHFEDEKLFVEYADGAKKAYDFLFVKQGIDTDRQAKLVRPLAFNLVEGANRSKLEERLVEAVKSFDFCVGTGFLSTALTLPVLTRAGQAEIAYKMLENEKSPSWLAEVNAGATTIWESWEGADAEASVASLNHYSPGAVGEWLFDTVAGIRINGENSFEIAPVPGGSLSFADCEYLSIYGRVSSRWEKSGEKFCLTVSIPPNTSAEILLPNGERTGVLAGEHSFVF